MRSHAGDHARSRGRRRRAAASDVAGGVLLAATAQRPAVPLCSLAVGEPGRASRRPRRPLRTPRRASPAAPLCFNGRPRPASRQQGGRRVRRGALHDWGQGNSRGWWWGGGEVWPCSEEGQPQSGWCVHTRARREGGWALGRGPTARRPLRYRCCRLIQVAPPSPPRRGPRPPVDTAARLTSRASRAQALTAARRPPRRIGPAPARRRRRCVVGGTGSLSGGAVMGGGGGLPAGATAAATPGMLRRRVVGGTDEDGGVAGGRSGSPVAQRGALRCAAGGRGPHLLWAVGSSRRSPSLLRGLRCSFREGGCPSG